MIHYLVTTRARLQNSAFTVFTAQWWGFDQCR